MRRCLNFFSGGYGSWQLLVPLVVIDVCTGVTNEFGTDFSVCSSGEYDNKIWQNSVNSKGVGAIRNHQHFKREKLCHQYKHCEITPYHLNFLVTLLILMMDACRCIHCLSKVKRFYHGRKIVEISKCHEKMMSYPYSIHFHTLPKRYKAPSLSSFS